MSEKEQKEFVKNQVEGMTEVLKNTAGFMCACCGETKQRNEADRVRIYKPESKDLAVAMGKKVASYVICLECKQTLPPAIVHTKVTAYLGTQGLFG